MLTTRFLPRSGASIALALAFACLAPAAAEVAIDAPRAGWRTPGDASPRFLQEVHYPAASVNAAGHPAAGLIKGRIAGTRKPGTGPRAPARLIVNGVAMPLLLDETGRFERPYAFGAGSNSVEVRSADGRARRRVQFHEAPGSRPQARLRILLAWDSDGTDLDLHVVSPDGEHVFYSNRVARHGGALDVDVTTGYGPEIYASPAPPHGVYHVYVNYYGAGEGRGDVTTAQVAIVSQEGTLSEKRDVVQVPLRKAGELTLVKSFVYP